MPKGIYQRRPRPPRYSPVHVARIRELYEAGGTQAEVATAVGLSLGTVQLAMYENGIARRRAGMRRGVAVGPACRMWKGESAGYTALHYRVRDARGAPSACERCGTDDPNTRYEWANLTGNYADVADYERMCCRCHRRYDASRRRASGKRTSDLDVRRSA